MVLGKDNVSNIIKKINQIISDKQKQQSIAQPTTQPGYPVRIRVHLQRLKIRVDV